jgi:hypothetical protein
MDCRCGCIDWIGAHRDVSNQGYPRGLDLVVMQYQSDEGIVEWKANVAIKTYDCETLIESFVRNVPNIVLKRARYSQWRARLRVYPSLRSIVVLGFTIPVAVPSFRPWGPWRRTQTDLPEQESLNGMKPCWLGGPGCP